MSGFFCGVTLECALGIFGLYLIGSNAEPLALTMAIESYAGRHWSDELELNGSMEDDRS